MAKTKKTVTRKTAKRKAVKKPVERKAKAVEKKPVEKPTRGYKNKVLRKWLYQCAYWRVCESCSLREECLKEMEKNGIEKPWLQDQIKGIKRFK